GLAEFFERQLSADVFGRLKPAPEPYRAAARELGVEVGQVRLVAAHAWDVQGALRAGCGAAFVARPGAMWNPLLERPDIMGNDLAVVIGAAGESRSFHTYRTQQGPPLFLRASGGFVARRPSEGCGIPSNRPC